MTTKDKTGDQLVASIRKSKTGAVARKTTGRTAAARPAAAGTARATGKAAASVQQPSGSGNQYHHGRRVWPD